MGASAKMPASVTASRVLPPCALRQVLSLAAAIVLVTASKLPMPMSSKTITISRRQIAAPLTCTSASAARWAISISPRRMDFCSRLLITHGSATMGFIGRAEWESISQASLSLAGPNASRMTSLKS